MRRRPGGPEEALTSQPDFALVGVLRIPESHVSPDRAISRRLAAALLALFAAVIIVYLDRAGYRHVWGGSLSFLDCVDYATVSLSTTGVRRHHAVHRIRPADQRPDHHPTADRVPDRVGRRLASAQHAASIVVATNRDDTAVLVTLTARELAPKAKIVASIREAENQHLLRQSGADSVVVSSETAGRLLGIATTAPTVVEMIEDLLTPDQGFAIAEREVETGEVGGSPRHVRDIVFGVVRDGTLLRVDDPAVDAVEPGDRLLYIHGVDH